MSGFRLTARARTDLEGIGRYTQHRWGREARNEYLHRLEKAFEQLVANSQMGRRRDELPEGIRTFSVASHLVIYQVERH